MSLYKTIGGSTSEVTENNVPVAKVIEGNNSAVFSNLPVCNDSEVNITYTTKETKIEQLINGVWTDITNSNSIQKIDSSAVKVNAETTTATVTKKWEGTNNPENYKSTFALYEKIDLG